MVNTEELTAKLQASLPSKIMCIAEIIFGIICVGFAVFFPTARSVASGHVGPQTVLLVLGGAALGRAIQATRLRAKISELIAGVNGQSKMSSGEIT